MAAKETPDVRVGQVWADNDKRTSARHVKVLAIEQAKPAEPHKRAVPARAQVALCRADGTLIRVSDRLTLTRIKLDRFRPTSNGYRLVRDADPAAPAAFGRPTGAYTDGDAPEQEYQ